MGAVKDFFLGLLLRPAPRATETAPPKLERSRAEQVARLAALREERLRAVAVHRDQLDGLEVKAARLREEVAALDAEARGIRSEHLRNSTETDREENAIVGDLIRTAPHAIDEAIERLEFLEKSAGPSAQHCWWAVRRPGFGGERTHSNGRLLDDLLRGFRSARRDLEALRLLDLGPEDLAKRVEAIFETVTDAIQKVIDDTDELVGAPARDRAVALAERQAWAEHKARKEEEFAERRAERERQQLDAGGSR